MPIAVLMNTLAIGLSGMHAAGVRLAASAHNVANLTNAGFYPVRTVQTDLANGGSTARIERAARPAPVNLVRETAELSRAALQYTASLRLVAVDADLRGQLADLLV